VWPSRESRTWRPMGVFSQARKEATYALVGLHVQACAVTWQAGAGGVPGQWVPPARFWWARTHHFGASDGRLRLSDAQVRVGRLLQQVGEGANEE
jgi:hypothetical protein